MTLTRKRYKPRKPWLCPKCGAKNEHRTSSRKCQGCNENTKPRPRVPKHERVMQETGYEAAARLSVEIHGTELHECGACFRLPVYNPPRIHHDRDHGHRQNEASYGKIRGLACVRCNKELLRNSSFVEAVYTAAYFARAELYHGADDDRMRSFLAWFDAVVSL